MTAVDYVWNRERRTLACEGCVLATGAWTPELLRGADVQLPLIRKKCLVLVLRSSRPRDSSRPRFDRITVWLDVPKEDGARSDVTIVPFNGRFLAAGNDFRVVYQVGEGELQVLSAGQLEVAALKRDLEMCADFAVTPLDRKACETRTCYKTEQYNPAHPDVDIKVCATRTSELGVGHGLKGLIVALPGKASLMFDLAREVARRVR